MAKAKKKPAAKQSEESKPDSEEQDRSLTPYQPKHRPLQNSSVDQHAEEARRQAELQAERDKHDKLTGDVSR